MATAADTIGAALVHSNLLQPAELERALIVNGHNGDGLGPLLVRLGLVSEQALARAYAERHGLPVLQEHEWPDMPVNLANLSHKFLKQARALPVRADDEGITLAVADPEDRFTVKAVEVACDRPVVMKLATVSQVERALERLYGGDKSRMEGIVEEIRPEDVASAIDSIEELRNLAAEAPIVRQDPDVIMIGEMRDLETARIAVQSALTGHLVFSTLHTNDAGSSVTRLLDMGVEDYLLTSTLNGIMAQRLVRTLCPDCREPGAPALPDELRRWLATENSSGPEDDLLAVLSSAASPAHYARGSDLIFYRASGCKTCAYSGYHGRTVISELLILSEPVRRLILSRADGRKIQDAAVNAGMHSMKIDGLRKALQGLTTFEEVARVTQG